MPAISTPVSSKTFAPSAKPAFLWRTLVVLVLVGITLLACFHQGNMNQMSEPGVVMQLPDTVAGFKGTPQKITEAERVILPPDTELVRKSYINDSDDQITQTIVLSGGEKRSIHRPEICLPGQGWTISGQETIPVKLKSGRSMDVVNLTLTREATTPSGAKQTIRGYFIYWFVGKNRTTASQITRILTSAWDRLTTKTNHRWAYVIVSGLITEGIRPGGKNSADTMEMAKDFIRESVPYFQKAEMPSEIGDKKP